MNNFKRYSENRSSKQTYMVKLLGKITASYVFVFFTFIRLHIRYLLPLVKHTRCVALLHRRFCCTKSHNAELLATSDNDGSTSSNPCGLWVALPSKTSSGLGRVRAAPPPDEPMYLHGSRFIRRRVVSPKKSSSLFCGVE